ncbi:hypothetical protein VTI74DRAFT_2392 [Chaetomium olivicolor]
MLLGALSSHCLSRSVYSRASFSDPFRHKQPLRRQPGRTPYASHRRRPRRLYVRQHRPLLILGLSLNLKDLPAPQAPQEHGASEEHDADKDLRGQELMDPFALDQLQRDGLAKRGGQHERKADCPERAASLGDPHDFGQDRVDGTPERARHHAGRGREHDQAGVAARQDPERQAQHATQQRHVQRHVDAPNPVAVVAHDGPPQAYAQAQQRLYHGPLRRAEPERRGVAGQAVRQRDVAELGHEAPAEDEEDLDAEEVAEVERVAASAAGGGGGGRRRRRKGGRRGGPFAEEQDIDGVGGERDEAENAPGPCDARHLDEMPREQAVGGTSSRLATTTSERG